MFASRSVPGIYGLVPNLWSHLFTPDPTLTDFDLLNPENTDLEDFKQRYKSSPLLRAKKLGFLRNIIVAIGNINSTKTISNSS